MANTIKNRIPDPQVMTHGIMGVVDMIRQKSFFKVMDESYKSLIKAENVNVLYTVEHYDSSGKFNSDVHVREVHLDLVFEHDEKGDEVREHFKCQDPWEFTVKKYHFEEDDDKTYNSDHYAHSIEIDFAKQNVVIYFT